MAFLRQACSVFPFIVWCGILSGNALSEMKEWPDEFNSIWKCAVRNCSDARTLLQQYIERHPDYWRAYETLAKLYEEQNATQEGVEFFRGLVQKYPDRAFAWLGFGEVLRQSPPTRSQAYRAFAKCAAIKPHPSRCFIAAAQEQPRRISELPRNPAFPGYWLARCVNGMAVRQRDAALEACGKAVTLADSAADSFARIEARRNLATALRLNNDNHEPAVIPVQEALELTRQIGDREQEFEALRVLTGLYNQLGRREEAAAQAGALFALAEAVAHPEWKRQARWVLVDIYKTSGRLVDAERLLSELVDLSNGAWVIAGALRQLASQQAQNGKESLVSRL